MTLVILCVAAFAVISYAASGAVALGLRSLRHRTDRTAPAARARLYLVAALLPFLSALAILTAALAPTFGWIADHCGVLGDPHPHPHICVEHHVAVWPAIWLTTLAFAMALRFSLAVTRLGYAVILGRLTQHRLRDASHPGNELDIRVLPLDEPQAFVLGIFRPQLYITRGLAEGAQRRHLPAVVAHERGHVQRRDPLRRVLAGIGLAFHLPGVAGRIAAQLTRAQEMAADLAAAQSIGSRESVARALIALAKARVPPPRGAFAFSGSELESRVVQLMDETQRRDWPTTSTLLCGGLASLMLLASGAEGVHHGVELLLGALGS
ncbi:MAG: M56 family metallopeptidase [Nannocystaceae bacterium]